jgi:hypothetical protein
MALADWRVGGEQVICLRSEGGPTEDAGNLGFCGSWTNAEGGSITLANGAAPPVYTADPGDGLGAVADCQGDNGFNTGVATGTVWSAVVADHLDTLGGFQNFLGSNGSTDFGVYLDGSTWTLQDGANSTTFGAAATADSDIIVGVVRTATAYRVWLNGVEVLDTTGIGWLPAQTPTLVTHSYGGGAALDGQAHAIAVYNTDVSASMGALATAGLEEINGPSQSVAIAGASTVAATGRGVVQASAPITGSSTVAATAVGVAARSVAITGDSTLDATPASSGPSTAITGSTSLVASAVGFARRAVAIAGLTVLAATLAADAGLADDFAGTGDLIGYTTQNPTAITELGRVADRYRARVPAGDASATTFFDADEGRLDAKQVAWAPGDRWEVIYRNVGIGTAADSQVPLPTTGDPFAFCGWHVNDDLSNATQNSAHVVVGHRGPEHNTIEGKVTVGGNSSVRALGLDALLTSRCDIRIVGRNVAGVKSITVYWRNVGDTAWTLYDDGFNPAGTIGTLPTFGDVVWMGPITYGFETVPEFVGTIDAIEAPTYEVPIAGSSTLTATGVGVAARSCAITGSSVLAAAATGDAARSTAITGASTLAASGRGLALRSAALAGSSTVATSAVGIAGRSCTVAGSSTLAAAAVGIASRSAALLGSTALVATGRDGNSLYAALTGSSSLVAAGRGVAARSCSMVGSSALTATIATPAAALDVVITATSRPATFIEIDEDPMRHTAGDNVETTIRFRIGGTLTAPDAWSIRVKPRNGAAFTVPSSDASVTELEPGAYLWTQATTYGDPTHYGRWDYTVVSDGSVARGARAKYFEVRKPAA